MKRNDKPILAFAHITRTGGNTFIHVLRHNYFLKSCDVRPLSKKSRKIFSAEDLLKMLKINPFIECIMGHSVRPHSNLETVFPNIEYISMLRDPINQYISRYLQRIRKEGKLSFEDFLKNSKANGQTKFIAGREDLSAAKEILSEKYFAVGILEEFNEFLIMLKKKLHPRKFDPSYRIVNISKNTEHKKDILSRYKDRIIEKNRFDVELYNHVKEVIIPKQIAWYGPDFQKDVQDFKASLEHLHLSKSKGYVDYLIRRMYYKPTSGIVRVLNGLPYEGLK